MKRFLAIALAATVALAFASVAQATDAVEGTYGAAPSVVGNYTAGMAANGIQAARHNLGSMGTAVTASPSVGSASSTSEICVFCHTPHHAVQGNTGRSVLSDIRTVTGAATNAPSTDTGFNASSTTRTLTFDDGTDRISEVITYSAMATNSTNDYSPAPIWNRRSSAASFTAYGSTIGGTNPTGTGLQIGGVTLACLSCHDGVTTFDNLVNAPGPGGMQSIYGDAGKTGADGSLGGSKVPYTFMDEGGAGQPGNLGGEDRLNIGKGTSGAEADLSNDHPMSINYNDGGAGSPGLHMGGRTASLRNSDTIIANINLAAGLFTTVPELSNNLSQNRWAVKGFISTTATINDLLRNGKVECSSCHDPHFKNLSNVDLDNTEIRNGYGAGGYNLPGNSSGKKDDGAFGQNLIQIDKTGAAVATGDRVLNADGLFLRRVGGNAGSGVCRTCHNK